MPISSVNPPGFIKSINKHIIWENTTKKVVLTFDDGPHPDATLIALESLKKYNYKALFFLSGENITNYRNLVGELSEFCFIANHSYYHRKSFIFQNKTKIEKEIADCESILKQYKNKLNLFRPPYGYFRKAVSNICNNSNLKIMLWSLMTEDYLNNEKIFIKNIRNNLKQNSILVFHDNAKTKNNIRHFIEIAIEIILEKGYYIESDFNF